MAEKVRIKRNSKSSCCVAGCSNTYRNTGEETHFYRFPAAIRFPGRKELWINAIREAENGNRQNWTPSPRALVCSMHFVGGKKNDHPQHPAYVPTIFSSIYKTSVKSGHHRMSRFQKNLKRPLKQATKPKISRCTSFESYSTLPFKSVATNCCLLATTDFSIPVFSCCMSGNDAATQTSISAHGPMWTMVGTAGPLPGDECARVGRSGRGFNGYRSITTDSELFDLAGVSRRVFDDLYGMVQPHLDDKSDDVHPLDRFLMFLMKLKLGLPSTALAAMFGVRGTTAGTIFGEVLDILAFKTQCLDYLFWPSRAIVQATMPDVFRVHFPNCRAILNCAEVRTEVPSSVENQLHFYSTYAHNHTAKLLLAFTPSGFVSFVSQAYGGHCSDDHVVSDCGILDLVEPGDAFVSDRQLPAIANKLHDDEAVMVVPPFSSGSPLGLQQVKGRRRITYVRKYVDKVVQCLNVYKVLDRIEIEQLPNIDKIIRVCCVLINMQSPVVEMY